MAEQDIFIQPEVLRSIDSATFTGSFQAVGTPLLFPSRILKFTNNSSVLVTLSWNGTDANEALPANSFLLLDVASNKELTSAWWAKKGTQFYVSGSAGTGSFYISSYYG